MGGMSETHRRVLLAKPRGYCAGVDRAVQAVEIALTRFGAPVYVRKQIVHNTHVVNELEKRGAVFVEETDEVPEGSVVLFSAHGIAPEVRKAAEERGLRAIDATCPLVTKVHNEARRFAAGDYDILLIGHEGHEEVVGTTGEAPDRVTLVDGPESAASVEVRDPAKVVWLSQTTLSVDETVQTVGALRERFPQLIDPPSDDICYATQNRQAAVKVIARDADVVIVVGSPNSSNSVRLVEVAKDAGAGAAYLVDDAGRGRRPLAGGGRHGGRDERCLGSRGTGRRRARQARRARIRGRGRGRGGQGADGRSSCRASCDQLGNERSARTRARTSERRPRSSAMRIVSPVPANSQPAELASATTVPENAASSPAEISAFSSMHAVKNSSGGDTTTGSSPLGRT